MARIDVQLDGLPCASCGRPAKYISAPHGRAVASEDVATLLCADCVLVMPVPGSSEARFVCNAPACCRGRGGGPVQAFPLVVPRATMLLSALTTSVDGFTAVSTMRRLVRCPVCHACEGRRVVDADGRVTVQVHHCPFKRALGVTPAPNAMPATQLVVHTTDKTQAGYQVVVGPAFAMVTKTPARPKDTTIVVELARHRPDGAKDIICVAVQSNKATTLTMAESADFDYLGDTVYPQGGPVRPVPAGGTFLDLSGFDVVAEYEVPDAPELPSQDKESESTCGEKISPFSGNVVMNCLEVDKMVDAAMTTGASSGASIEEVDMIANLSFIVARYEDASYGCVLCGKRYTTFGELAKSNCSAGFQQRSFAGMDMDVTEPDPKRGRMA
jgi:hypothetical protein